ncbi:MAG TPA: TadE/TadG family type IV pilus assembly protein, partial [Hyphomicrobiaceae bacterium]|nr:TadE/TadG family type IV pilus assembly protein [Hyphomicrobiaceae bacterium]
MSAQSGHLSQVKTTGRSLCAATGAATAKLSAFSSRFSRNESGAVAIIFALTATIVLGMIGGAVDYGRWLSARTKTMNAIDTAVLAAGRVLQLSNASESQAIAVAQQYYNKNKSNLLNTANVTFSVENGNTVVGSSTSSVNTPFLSLVGVAALPVNTRAKAELAASGNAGTHIEISLMLDATGSMSGSKIQDLKDAANDLVDIVVWADQSEFTSKVAIVPFAPYVSLEADAFMAVTNAVPGNNGQNNYNSNNGNNSGTASNGNNGSSYGNSQMCLQERSNSNRYTDAAPSSANGYFDYYTSNGTCKPDAKVLPLTNVKVDLHDRINSMNTTGATAGHLGTAWAWYALSPNFSSVWPSSSTPKSYSMLTELNDEGQPKLQKIAVLMTDGEFNTWYSGDNSATQARAICANMKATGI